MLESLRASKEEAVKENNKLQLIILELKEELKQEKALLQKVELIDFLSLITF
jgi:hypothetical protein